MQQQPRRTSRIEPAVCGPDVSPAEARSGLQAMFETPALAFFLAGPIWDCVIQDEILRCALYLVGLCSV